MFLVVVPKLAYFPLSLFDLSTFIAHFVWTQLSNMSKYKETICNKLISSLYFTTGKSQLVLGTILIVSLTQVTKTVFGQVKPQSLLSRCRKSSPFCYDSCYFFKITFRAKSDDMFLHSPQQTVHQISLAFQNYHISAD